MQKKFMKTMLIISTLLLLLFGIIAFQMFGKLRYILVQNSERTGQQVEEYSDNAMRDQITRRLRDTTLGCAYTVNEILGNFAGTVTIIADAATDIYSNPDKYGKAEVKIPDKSDIGKSIGQFVYAFDVDPSDPEIQQELSMIGNQQGNLLAMYGQYEELGASYIGTETGIMLLAGPVLSDRWDENGNYVYLDPRKRPWYMDTKEAGTVHFSEITEDYDTGRLAIMCGAPVYRNKEFVGVAGAGLYLEGVEKLMMNAKIGENGDACIIDEKGRVVFSSRDTGELKPQTILGKGNEGLAFLSHKAIMNGESGLELLDVDGEKNYVAYSPIEVVGWSLISIIPEKTVIAPKEKLLYSLKESGDHELMQIQNITKSAIVTIFGIIVAMGFLSTAAANVLSKKLVKPIETLTEKVESLEGDQLDFEWDINTGDEVQKLASTFGLMTMRMKRYISYIQFATAEKERISAELSLATKIQTSMLPHEFPPFPERPEFDIYATMEPAREVGGDFYDFFMIDDDHLGLVMADVSGKGIPAALFMMTAKTTIQSYSMKVRSAAEILRKTNNSLLKNNQTDMFVTVWLGILEISTGILSCANAGHEYPAVMKNGGQFELLKDKHGFVIGGMEGVRYKEYTIELARGDKIFLYTDGVPEAADADNNMYGTERMINALNKDASSPKEVLKNVHDDINSFVNGAEQFDDLTMMCLEFK